MSPYFKKYRIVWKPKTFRKNFILKNVKIIFDNKRKIGFYKLLIREGGWYIGDIQIINSMTGKGIGTEILRKIEKKVKRDKGKKIRLRVFVNNSAIRLYKREGFRKIKKEENNIVMEKKLKI